jgi:arylsulfatase A-like enzyme
MIACGPAEPVPPHIVLVSMDTLRWDRVGRLGPDGRSITPNLDALAAQSVVFERAYSVSNESLFAHAALFTGKLPSAIGPLDYRVFQLTPGATTVASVLSGAGYRTEAAVGGGHLSAQFGFGTGFDEYQEGEHFSGFQQTVPMAMARLERASAVDEPLFLFVHGYDCHTPYIKPGLAGRAFSPGYDGPFLTRARTPIFYEQVYGDWYAPGFQPERISGAGQAGFISTDMFDALRLHVASADPDALTRLTPEDKAFLLGTYDAAAMYADMWLGVLLQRIEALGLGENTVVAVISDHGEDLLDHGFFNHRAGLWEETLHVPMMIRAPGLKPAVRAEPVALTDLSATLLELTGTGATLPGTDLFNAPIDPARVIVSEGAGGQLAARNATHSLVVQRGTPLTPEPPSAAPPNATLADAAGRALPWSVEIARPMWTSLAVR